MNFLIFSFSLPIILIHPLDLSLLHLRDVHIVGQSFLFNLQLHIIRRKLTFSLVIRGLPESFEDFVNIDGYLLIAFIEEEISQVCQPQQYFVSVKWHSLQLDIISQPSCYQVFREMTFLKINFAFLNFLGEKVLKRIISGQLNLPLDFVAFIER